VAPKFYFVKQRNAAGESWIVYHSSIGATNYLQLNSTIASTASSSAWNNTAPTSSVFTVGAGAGWGTNDNGSTYIAYCWSEVAGYSSIGSYTGNGSTDGPFVYTGFRPRFILLKDVTTGATNWEIHDVSRDTYNQVVTAISPNSTAGDSVYGSSQGLDILSNGFKVRLAGSPINTSAATHIYAAFAENPFKYALAR
jgi:hypothetical protein